MYRRGMTWIALWSATWLTSAAAADIELVGLWFRQAPPAESSVYVPVSYDAALADTSDEWSDEGGGCYGGCHAGCCGGDCGCGGGCGGACCGRGSLLGFIQPTDLCWSGFISPMTNPVFFEDPRTLTEARLIFLHHKLPSLLGGAVPSSDVQVVALQLRAALTDDLSIIATKDGFIFASPDAPLDDGWADVALGLKYNLYKDPVAQQIVSAGVTFELPTGSTRARQGTGDGEFNLFLTGGTQLGDYSHLISAAGFRLPTHRGEESSVFYWSNHIDRQLLSRVYGFLECNWYHWMGSGRNGIPGVEGVDLFNFGSTGVSGNDIVTGAFGFKIKPTPWQEIGVAWEVPLTERRDILENRLTADWIVRY